MRSSAIALAVSAIPEGLPALAASTKALAARAMSREGAFVRNVNVLETAASIDVLCLDKTGTLTQNRMEAAVVQTLTAEHRIDNGASLPPGTRLIAKIAALCNDAALSDAADPSSGSGTELALLHFARDAGFDVAGPSRGRTLGVAVLPRTQARLYMATEHAAGGGAVLAVKGAPHQVLDLCATVRSGAPVRSRSPHEAARHDPGAE